MSLMESSKSPIKTGMEISSNIVNQLKGKLRECITFHHSTTTSQF